MSETSEPQGRDGAGELRVRLADGTEAALPTWVRRGQARAIDALVVAAFVTIVAVVGGLVEIYQHLTFLGEVDEGNPRRDLAIWVAAVYTVTILYEVLAVAVKGQTYGKLKTGLMVMSTSGGRVSLGRSALRWLVPAVTSLCGVAAVLWAFVDSSDSVWVWLGALMGYQVLCGAPAVWLLLFVAALRDGHRRGVHDLAAGTIVVAERSASSQR